MNASESIVVSLEHAKLLKEAGWPQDNPTFVYVEAGQQYGDGYSNTACDLTPGGLYFVGGDYGYLGTGEMSASGQRDYKGGTKFPAVKVGQYGDDNYFEYPVL